MKTSTYTIPISKNNIRKRFILLNGKILIFLMTAITIFVLGSCAKKIVFPVSPTEPAAQGTILFKTDKNKNYAIDLTVKHLANPERLTPARKCYVVWIETAQNGVINLGQLHISKNMGGSLKTNSPYKPNTIFITAEDDPTIKEPGMYTVLRSESFNLK
jgi:hypothetical protein